MSELTDLILQTTDPVSAILLLVIAGYIRAIKQQIRSEIQTLRERTQRLEGTEMERAVNGADD